MTRAWTIAAVLAVIATPAGAIDISVHGYGDARLVVPPADDSYLDGGLGKLRFGRDDGSPNLHLAGLVGEARVLLMPELTAAATARIDPDYGPAIDLLDAWVRYRPVSTSRWEWSVKAGAFFPPISLENDQIGWTSFWTLTPSAINSWIGNELRIIGTEGTLAWRRDEGDVTLIGAVFGWNDNAGEFIADRGWNFDDRVTGLFEKQRIPDATVVLIGGTPPDHEQLFKEIDSAPGWYLDLSYEPEGIGGFEVMRYDNNADPRATRGDDTAWHTSFWDFGFDKQMGRFTILAQGLLGSTIFQPAPAFRLDTNFRSAYVLAGLDLDRWWFAARAEVFDTHSHDPAFDPNFSEDGMAGTLSANWLAATWLRLSGEVLVVDSNRRERILAGDKPRQIETQLQLAARLYF